MLPGHQLLGGGVLLALFSLPHLVRGRVGVEDACSGPVQPVLPRSGAHPANFVGIKSKQLRAVHGGLSD